MAEVILSGVSKLFPGEVRAVEDFHLRVRDREFVVLVGPSGCGKTTTLRLVAGLEQVSAGEIRIGDRVVNDVPPKDRDIAMVFQNYALYPHMTVYDNMAFGLKLRRTPKAEIAQRVRAAAGVLGLDDLLKRRPSELSGGQRQRVALGRAIVRHPAVFLLDEPLSNLDAKMRMAMRGELKRLHRRLDATMIYVTHDQVEAMTLGQRLVVMNAGRIEQVGEPLAVYDRPANRFVAGFLGTPPINFLRGVLTERGGEMVFDLDGQALPIPRPLAETARGAAGRDATLGIRPEGFSIAPSGADAPGALSARVEVTEPLGDEVILNLTLGDQACAAKVPSHQRCGTGDVVRLRVAPEKVYLFEAESGRNIGFQGRVNPDAP